MQYIIYCDESDKKGTFYSNFYGGALIKAGDREAMEASLKAAKGHHNSESEFKWQKIGPHNEADYINFVDAAFEHVANGALKMRVMFTQNINQTKGRVEYGADEYFVLYYHFLKHAFGLRYCNPDQEEIVNVAVYMDDVPDKSDEYSNFRDYLSGLSTFPVFFNNRILLTRDNIASVASHHHNILQAVDVILGSIQFKLNEKHMEKAEGQRIRGKRTRAKERVYKHINRRIRAIYPNFNVGISTGCVEIEDRWHHPYRHWCFVPTDSVPDLNRGKKKKKKKQPR